MHSTDNLRVKDLRPLISPEYLAEEIPLSEKVSQVVIDARKVAADIIHGKDDRLLVIVGPCSIHDTAAAMEYAKKLKVLADKYQQQLCIIMRVYFEKPRTTVGWKGLINDPHLNDSFEINQGLKIARQLLLDINQLELPTATEFLDTTIPQYISDLIAWAAIGARTTQSQIHRQLASGLSMPVGFKNNTDGNIKVAVDAVYAALKPHHFLGVTKQGIAAIVTTDGNPDCHVILRGGSTGPNYDLDTITATANLLEQTKLHSQLMIDCSHGNSNKDYRKQKNVIDYLCNAMREGNMAISGLMIESNLVAGNQAVKPDTELTYGQSITDACIDWQETAAVLEQLSQAVIDRRHR